jgi:peptide-methionine (S)-S-oxide reductase
MLRTLLVLALLTAGAATPRAADLQTAIFAGGCFWCVESDFDKVPGVVETVSGYTGGTLDNPSYQQVSSQTTGHFEAVRITYDADQVSYRQLVDVLWRTIDPTDNGGQFCDRGPSYRTAVFAADAAEATTAKASRAEAQAALGQEIVTPILEAGTFWPAENYHQDYYHTNPVRYEFYRRACGRDARLRQLWGDKPFGAKS